MKLNYYAILLLTISLTTSAQISQNAIGLQFNQLPKRWDEGLPLGNGIIGELIWQKDNKLRFSLDHAELWDLRPMKELHTPGFNYTWVKEQILKDNYKAVQQIGDESYEREPAPSKLPGAALEFDIANWGTVKQANLNIENAAAEVLWENGTKLTSFVHANKPIGYFRFENIKDFDMNLLAPKYEGAIDKNAGGSVAGDDLARLGYRQGKVTKTGQSYIYEQEGWGGFKYQVSVK